MEVSAGAGHFSVMLPRFARADEIGCGSTRRVPRDGSACARPITSCCSLIPLRATEWRGCTSGNRQRLHLWQSLEGIANEGSCPDSSSMVERSWQRMGRRWCERIGRAVTAGLWALGICVGAVLLEGLFAGRGVRRRLAELRQPRHSPPFRVWIVIGFVYYLICFVVLSRLIDSVASPLRSAALVLVVALLIGNAVWNLVFFRLGNLELSVVVSMAYAALALAAAPLLLVVDPVSALVFLPYLIYLSYATWWVRALKRLNQSGVA